MVTILDSGNRELPIFPVSPIGQCYPMMPLPRIQSCGCVYFPFLIPMALARVPTNLWVSCAELSVQPTHLQSIKGLLYLHFTKHQEFERFLGI